MIIELSRVMNKLTTLQLLEIRVMYIETYYTCTLRLQFQINRETDEEDKIFLDLNRRQTMKKST